MLTPIQIQIFKSLVEGLNFKEVGQKINRSQYTVNNEVVNARQKLGVSNNVHAVYILTKQGII